MPNITTPSDLSGMLREHTWSLHARAEGSGIVAAILNGTANRFGYALFLRNLLPIYLAMEESFDRHVSTPGVRAIVARHLYRGPAIQADLEDMFGPTWTRALPALPASDRYAARIREVALTGGVRLIAHGYVRYLGDLSGGQVLQRMLARRLGLPGSSLSFYDFREITDPKQAGESYRRALDRAGSEIPDTAPVIAEARRAFRFNIALSTAVSAAAPPTSED